MGRVRQQRQPLDPLGDAAAVPATAAWAHGSPASGGGSSNRRGISFRRLVAGLAVRVSFVVFRLLALVYMLIHKLPGMPTLTIIVLTNVLRLIRWHMDGYWTRYSRNIWLPNPSNIAQDGESIMKGVAPIETVWYGDGSHPREYFHIVRPAVPGGPEYSRPEHGCGADPVFDATPEPNERVILYVHGGGFVCANSAVLIHSVTLFARQGYTVYSAEYPLAPQDPFPVPLIAIIRAIAYLHQVKGVKRVQLLGDSAGANLVTMASALITNRPLLEEMAAEMKLPVMTTWTFPHIISQVSLYGVLDQDSWKDQRVPGMGHLENALAVMGLHSCIALYSAGGPAFGGRMTLMDLMPFIKQLPPTCIVAAQQDALLFSSRVAHEQLKLAGFESYYRVFDSRHGFFGFPPNFPPSFPFDKNWKNSAQPCGTLVNKFFAKTSAASV